MLLSSILVAMLLVLSGCGDDETEQANGIVVEDASGNIISSGGDISIEFGPDGQVSSAGDEVVYDEQGSEDSPFSGEDDNSGPASPDEDPELMEEEVAAGVGDFAEEGVPVTEDDSPLGNGPDFPNEEVADAGSPFDITEDGADDGISDGTGPGGVDFGQEIDAEPPSEDYETAPVFSSTSVSADSVVSRAGKYISLGAGEETPDGSKNWTASNDKYNVEINADASGKVYSAYFSSTGDGRAFLADCASVFDSGAQSFINSNDSGTYESNGLIFEMEIAGREMCSLRIMSKSYEAILGTPE